MVKRSLFIIFSIFFAINTYAQKKVRIDLNKSQNSNYKSARIQNQTNVLKLKETLSFIEFEENVTKEGGFLKLTSNGTIRTYDSGKPNLPVISKLIDIPFNSRAVVKITNYDEEIINLKDYNLSKKIIPAQPSLSKSDDPSKKPFFKDEQIYNKDEFFANDIVKIEDKGYLRNRHIGYVEISPFQYNPVSNTIKILNNIEYEITFIDDVNISHKLSKSVESPYFNNIVNTVNKSSETKAILSGPIKYVIVSDRMFEETLVPFIEWKTQKGFNVVVAYTDDTHVGSTTTSIKAYLKDLYINPSDGVSPTFILFVGDVAQIPSFDTKLSGDYHVTDLYYCEYTDDFLPEVFYGRFSATTTDQLQAQVYKTLEVEKYKMPDPSYLNNMVLIAGVDGTNAPTYGNGFVNYANRYYANADNGINSYYYLYGDASGEMSSDDDAASASIQSFISAGVSIVNYTAHCSSNGWLDPSFSISDIFIMTNEHKYPLMIGNCCQSVKFEGSSFGEEILRASGKGAVGYIGGSDFTYWDEDYFWGVGLAQISANPTYDNSGLGAYDRFFHLNDEEKNDWFITQGQMVFAGNLEVEASSSSWKDYYWEIYHLMGDPSLVPYVTVPEILSANYNSEIIVNTTSFQVISEVDSYVALSQNGVLLDANLVDESGIVNLSFDEITGTGVVDIVITKQNKQPIIAQITIITDENPNIYVNEIIINDVSENDNGVVDYGESIGLNIKLQNSSKLYGAENITVTVSSTDTNVVISDNTEFFGSINFSESKTIESAIILDFKNRFTNNQKVEFEVELSWENSTKTIFTESSNFNVLVKAPEIQVNDLAINDNTGNGDGILDPGETVLLQLEIENIGESNITNIFGEINGITGSSYVSITNPISTAMSLNTGEKKLVEFEVSLSEFEDFKVPINIDFIIKDGTYNYYNVSDTKEIILGETPSCLISEEGTVYVDDKGAFFYDTGGEESGYANNENYTITFKPLNENSQVSYDFKSFDIEYHSSCVYDVLSVYDSSIVNSSVLIGSYCGTTSPGVYTASNTEGALTFVFSSDGGVTEVGWKAELFQVGTYQVTFDITDKNDEPLNGVNVNLGSKSTSTSSSGLAIIRNVVPQAAISYTLTKEGYDEYTGTVDVRDKDETVTIQMSLNTAIDDLNESDFKLYPNPSNGLFNIEFINISDASEYIIQVYNVLGAMVYNKVINVNQNSKEQIDITDKAKGMYILSIKSMDNKISNRRIIIK
jgi:hypothetical protein